MTDRDISKASAKIAKNGAAMAIGALQEGVSPGKSPSLLRAGSGTVEGAVAKIPNGVLATDDARQALLPQGQPTSDGARGSSAGGALLPSSPLRQLVEADWFTNLSIGLVVFNIVVMCAPFAGQPQWYAILLEVLSTLVTLLFALEMALKVVALGWGGYWSNGWNQLDGSVVIISMFELLSMILLAGIPAFNFSYLRALRMLRVLRMLRLLKQWRGLFRIVSTLIKAMPQMSNVVLLMVLAIIIFALLGKEFFGGKLNPPSGELTRYHFDEFFPSVLTVFIILMGKWKARRVTFCVASL